MSYLPGRRLHLDDGDDDDPAIQQSSDLCYSTISVVVSLRDRHAHITRMMLLLLISYYYLPLYSYHIIINYAECALRGIINNIIIVVVIVVVVLSRVYLCGGDRTALPVLTMIFLVQ